MNIVEEIFKLDGFAACNLAEPSEGDLARIYEAYRKCWAERYFLIEALTDVAKAPCATSDATQYNCASCLANDALRIFKTLDKNE